MKKKTFIVLVSILTTGTIGFYLGKNSIPTKKNIAEKKMNRQSPPKKLLVGTSSNLNNEPQRTIASTIQTSPNIKTIYLDSEYWQQATVDSSVRKLYEKTYEQFKTSPQAEDIAVWTALGLIFDSSEAYGELLTSALREINLNKEENFAILKNVINKMPPEDSFLRGMMLNLANNMAVSQNEKTSFFGGEITRSVKFDNDGKFTPDSLNITTAMIFLKHNLSDPKDAKSYILKSLANNKDPIAKKQIIVRFKAYFPELTPLFKD